jgi:hypothetical protein
MEKVKVTEGYVISFILIIAALVVLIIPMFTKERTRMGEPEFNVDTISVGDPNLGIEPARFYLVQNQWGYGIVQFKDTGLDKKLDKVFCNSSGFPFSPDRFNPNTGFPSDKVFDPNSVWQERFQRVLQEHEKKLKFQRSKQGPIK